MKELKLNDKKELANRFTYHTPKIGQPEKYEMLRAIAGDLAGIIVDKCPECRETSLAITKLEEAIFWANAAIARRE